MKKIIFLAACILMLQNILFAQSGFYTWIGHTPLELRESLGDPVQTSMNKGDSVYIYQTELGYSSYVLHDNKIIKANNTTYWKPKKKARSAFNTLLGYYKDDDFKVDSTAKDLVNLSNLLYKIKLEINLTDGWYGVSETATPLEVN